MWTWRRGTGVAAEERGGRLATDERPEPQIAQAAPPGEAAAVEPAPVRGAARRRSAVLAAGMGLVAAGVAAAAVLWRRRRGGREREPARPM